MLRSHWCIILAAFGWIALTGASPPNQRGQQPDTANQSAESAPPKAVGYRPYPGYNPDPCYNDLDHESADLCAQWRAALAAEKAASRVLWSNWISFAGALLSFVSVLLVLRALKQGREANEISRLQYEVSQVEAEASAKAAKAQNRVASRNSKALLRSVELSEKAMILTQRARIMHQRVNVAHSLNPTRLVMEVAWKNLGTTEAKRAMVYTEIQILDTGDELDLSYSQPSQEPAAVIGPQTERYSTSVAVDIPTLEAVWAGEKQLFVYSVCEYDDVFREEFDTPRRRSRFCGQINLPGPPNLIGTTVPYNVSFEGSGPGNDAT